MAKVTIKSMALENFKGIREMKLQFGHRTTISGANATGKTTIFDAFTWCLFGKDSLNRTDHGRGAFGIKTNDADGNVIDKLDHSVEIVLDVDGEELKIKRTLNEEWTVTNGTNKAEFAGNTFGYYWNELPIGATEFKKRVEATIMEEEKFKMMTNPHYFANMPWEVQLRYVNALIGEVSYASVAKGIPEWEAVIGNKSDDDVMLRKKVITQDKKQISKDLNNNEGDIKGIKKGTPERPDEAQLSILKARLEGEIEKLEREDSSAFEREKVYANVAREKQKRITELREQQNKIYLDAVTKATEEANAANMEYVRTEGEMKALESDIRNEKAILDSDRLAYVARVTTMEKDICRISDDMKALRDKWKAENEKEMQCAAGGCVMCPLTNKECDGAQAKIDIHNSQVRAQEEFNKRKEETLVKITENGVAMKNQRDVLIAEKDKMVEAADKVRADHEAKVESLEQKLTAIREKLVGCKKVSVAAIDKVKLPGWMEAEKEIDAIEGEIDSMRNDVPKEVSDDRKAAKAELKKKISEIDMELGLVKVIEANAKRIEEIEADNDKLAQSYANLEREEDVIAKVNKARIEEIEKRMAKTFEMVTFKFIETQINGGEVDTCVAMVDGVKYGDLNSAKKVNAGLDIINAICRHYGIQVPIFIDNAEGVNRLIDTDSQMILLEVTEDNPIVVRAE